MIYNLIINLLLSPRGLSIKIRTYCGKTREEMCPRAFIRHTLAEKKTKKSRKQTKTCFPSLCVREGWRHCRKAFPAERVRGPHIPWAPLSGSHRRAIRRRLTNISNKSKNAPNFSIISPPFSSVFPYKIISWLWGFYFLLFSGFLLQLSCSVHNFPKYVFETCICWFFFKKAKYLNRGSDFCRN